MAKFLIQNLLEVDLNLAVEPWADVAVIPPGEFVRFEYSEEDADVEFSVPGVGSASVSVLSKNFTMHLKDGPVKYS